MILLKSGIAALALIWCSCTAQAAMIGPILPYFGLLQSPFNGLAFSYFYLETYEEAGAPTVPGITESGGNVIGPGPFVDSVERLANGHDYFSDCGACGVTFTFSAAGLGGHLPTHVGIVWTDGDGPNRMFRAFDANNALIGTIIDSSPLFFSSGGDGDAANYRFFGATDTAGISSIFIANSSGGIEVDDLQFGFIPPTGVPEPNTLVLTLLGVGVLATSSVCRRFRF